MLPHLTRSQRELMKRFYVESNLYVDELHCQSKTLDPLVRAGYLVRHTEYVKTLYRITDRGLAHAEKLFNCLE